MPHWHQAYLVARVVPQGSIDGKDYYCCLGGCDHPMCYGSLPLQAADRFFELIKNPVNAAIIREELRSLHGKYGRTVSSNFEPHIHLPCHYSLFLLACAFNADFETGFILNESLQESRLPSTMEIWNLQNDDGMTIIDITDPLNPSYAFVHGDAVDSDFGDGPCTAEEYLRGYPDLGNKWEENAADEKAMLLAMKFESIPLLTEDMLAEVWPEDFGASKWQYRRRSVRNSVPNPRISRSVVPPLADLLIEPAVARALELGKKDEIELLIPGKASQIMRALSVHEPSSDKYLDLLLTLLERILIDNPGTLNLRGFSMSPAQLVHVVSHFPDARIVTLSHSPTVTVQHICALLAVKPEIDCLELLDTGVTDEDLSSLLETEPNMFKCVSDVVHRRLVSGRHTNPGSFHVFVSSLKDGSIQAIPIWTPAKILQNIVDLLTLLFTQNDPFENYYCDPIHSILIPAVMSSGLRRHDAPWRNRTVSMLARDMEQLHPGGWVFLFDREERPRGKPLGDRYAFARLGLAEKIYRGQVDLPDSLSLETFDLNGFLEEMKKEGRAPLPSTEIMKQFEDIMANGVRNEIAEKKVSKRIELMCALMIEHHTITPDQQDTLWTSLNEMEAPSLLDSEEAAEHMLKLLSLNPKPRQIGDWQIEDW